VDGRDNPRRRGIGGSPGHDSVYRPALFSTKFFAGETMCRNIRTLFNFEPPATDDEIRASALQFVRKLSGFTRPSRANEEAFALAVDEVSDVARRLLASLHTASPARDRETEAMKARERSKARYG
jgi:hypothetical protein